MNRAALAGLVVIGLSASAASAWDAYGHRTITAVALEKFNARVEGGPERAQIAWLFNDDVPAQVGFQAGEPDRYRSVRLGQLKHVNDPDHFLDIEDLEPFGLTLRSLPPLRVEYFRAMIIAKHEHPENARPYNERTDTARTQEFPGTLPFAIMEHYGRLVASLRTVRILHTLNEPARQPQLAAARASVVQSMGQLSHFVGDAAQPLHTTRHYNGWVDNQPPGDAEEFTTNKGFHAYIDTTVLAIHGFDSASIAAGCDTERTVDFANPWNDTLDLIERSHQQVIPLYKLQKSGDLEKEPGRALIHQQLCDASQTLAAFYFAAWRASTPTERDIADFIKYDAASSRTPNPMERDPSP